MKTTVTPPLVRGYELVCYIALGAMLLVQFQQGQSLANALVVAFGVLGVISKLRVGPILVVGGVAVSQIALHAWYGRMRISRPANLQMTDVVLTLAVLAYVAAHYRLQSIWQNILPVDPRRRPTPTRRSWWGGLKREPIVPQRRPEVQVSPGELIGLVVWVLVAVYSGWALWYFLAGAPGLWLVQARTLRVLWVLWIVGLGWWVGSIILDLWRQYKLSREAARVFLNDTLWRETRGEQRRIERWRAWQRLENERKGRS